MISYSENICCETHIINNLINSQKISDYSWKDKNFRNSFFLQKTFLWGKTMFRIYKRKTEL